MTSIDLYGQTAAVTGGGRGIGRVTAQTLAAAGATVAVLSRSPSELAESVTLIERAGGRARAFPLDVLNATAVAETLAEIARALGPLDLLVNNAGDGGPVGPLEETDPALWWHTQEVNLRGPMLCTHAVLPGMIERRRGRIINVSSSAAEISQPYFSSYIVSKLALNKMTELLAMETKHHGIAIFAISPGAVHTAMSEAFLESDKAARWMPWFRPMFAEHAGPPERAAKLCLTLASGQADSLTGKFLSITDDLAALAASATV
jgi:NAD(P)-dependent dehydrogenase (short-subunit alcohol dehydrogenase family)